LFTAGGIAWMVSGIGADVAGRGVAAGSTSFGVRLGAALDSNLWPLGVACSVGLPLLLFPAGQVRSRRWGLVVRALAVTTVLLLLTFAVTPGRFSGPTDNLSALTNPFGVDALASAVTPAVNIELPVFMLATLSAVVGVVLGFRSATGAERQQLRWVRAGAALALAGILCVYVGGYLLGLSPAAANLAVSVGIGCLPVTFTVAILRYRLYDLDRVVSRTVTYAALTGLLVASYAGLVTAVSRLTPGSSSLAVASSTLAVAALFQPLRRWLQGAVDRRFNRARYDAARTVEEFSLRLRDEVDLTSVRNDLLLVVRDTLQPSTVGLWLRASA